MPSQEEFIWFKEVFFGYSFVVLRMSELALYCRMVLKAGQLDEQQGEFKQEVVAANTTPAKLQIRH